MKFTVNAAKNDETCDKMFLGQMGILTYSPHFPSNVCSNAGDLVVRALDSLIFPKTGTYASKDEMKSYRFRSFNPGDTLLIEF